MSWTSELAGLKTGLAEVGDVVVELVERHFLGLAVFFFEVVGLLADLGEGVEEEGGIGGDGVGGEGAGPAVFEDPAVDGGVPAGGGGEDAALEGEGGGVELEDGEVGELVVVGVEELVVEDAGGLGVGRELGASMVWPEIHLRSGRRKVWAGLPLMTERRASWRRLAAGR